MNWRRWWIRYIPVVECFEDMTMNHPSSLFRDRSNDLKEFRSEIGTGLLMKIADTCNKHLYPTVLCPWGCSEYIHTCGCLGLDVMIQRSLMKCVIKKMMSNGSKMAYALSSRDDYVRESKDEYDSILLNNDWKVLPCVMIDLEKGPVVMTCRNHNGGTKKKYIHPPWHPYQHLASRIGDQLCHAVVKTRTV